MATATKDRRTPEEIEEDEPRVRVRMLEDQYSAYHGGPSGQGGRMLKGDVVEVTERVARRWQRIKIAEPYQENHP